MEVEPDEELVRRIIRQVEYCFGDYNLPKDKWMLEKLSEIKDGMYAANYHTPFHELILVDKINLTIILLIRLVRHGDDDVFSKTEELNPRSKYCFDVSCQIL